MKAAILGTTGYTGMVLLRMLDAHPAVETILPVSSSRAGEQVILADRGVHEKVVEKCAYSHGRLMTIEEAAGAKPDVVFSALPHLKSAELCGPFFGTGVVIDLSADFRIRDPQVFEKAYGHKQPRPDLQEQAVYGLCELYAGEIKKADLIANPGCYPTASLLPLVPLLKAGIIGGTIVINALSGISGAGKKANENLLYCTRTENANAYSPGTAHRHCQEIQQETDAAGTGSGPPVNRVLFTPHLVPVKRGMAVTTAVTLSGGGTEADAARILSEAYREAPFVKLTGNTIPQTADVWGSNRCDIGWHGEGDSLLLFSVIDNLVKGASGQAVQNMNLRFGLPETEGLKVHGEI